MEVFTKYGPYIHYFHACFAVFKAEKEYEESVEGGITGC